MMPAAKMMDPLLGLDIHMIQPPGPVPPLPIPHPFVGMLFDPMDLIPFVGATILVNGMPRGIAGTAAKAVPPHIPMGGVFVPPPPGNEGEMFMGSATVQMDGDPASYMFLPALTCQTIGMPAPFRMNPKKKTKMKSLQLPLSVVLPIPMGMPVLVGGPPTISMMGMLQKLGMAALGKAFAKWRKFAKGSKRAKAISRRIQNAAKAAMDKLGVPHNMRAMVHKAICTVTGHPVDVATGKVFTDTVDFSLPGPIPLIWERTWYSTSVYHGPIGHGWHHAYDLALMEDGHAVAVRMADGRPVGFPSLKPGESFYQRQDKLTLGRDDKGYFLDTPGHLRYRFGAKLTDGSQPLSRLENRDGFAIVFTRDNQGHLATITDSAGRRVFVQCDSLGRILTLETAHPDNPRMRLPLARYRYGETGDLLQATDALGHAWHYHYAGHLLTQETNRNGLNFYFEWDAKDHNAKCLRTWGDGGIYDHKLHYDLLAQTTVVTDSLGHPTTYRWNDMGVVEKTTDALGQVTEVTFTDFAEIAAETDALGFSTAFTYDDRGNLSLIQGADGSRIETLYAGDRPLEATDPLGGKWRWEYDEKGRLIRRVDPMGAMILFTYSDGLITAVQDAAGNTTTLGYDEKANLAKLELPGGATSSWEYDALGRCLSATDPLGNPQIRRFDAVGNVVRVQEPDGNVRSLSYDGEGNILAAKDMHYEVRFEYQGMSRLKTRHQAGTAVHFNYDTEERLIGIENEHGQAYRFQFDATGEVVGESGFDGLKRSYARDAKGRVATLTRANGKMAKYTYDAVDRVLVIEHGDEDAERFRYRADGSMMAAENANAKVGFERDPLGRVLKEIAGGHWVASEYDVLGRRCRMHSSLGAAQRISRTRLGDVETVTAGKMVDGGATAGADRHPDGGGFKSEWEARFKRDLLGQELNRELPGGLRATWKRDKLGRPIQQHIHSGSLVRERSYAWEPNDRIKSIVDSTFGARDYSYDALGNLAWSSMGQDFTFRAPDAVGNLFRTGEKGDRKYGPGGQLLEAKTKEGIATYSYDAEGNLIRKEVRKAGGSGSAADPATASAIWSYHWNVLGMLEKVVRPDGREVRFGYDALGRRLKKQFDRKTTHWVWDGNVPLHEWVVEKPLLGATAIAAQKRATEAAAADKRQNALLHSQPSNGPPASDTTAWSESGIGTGLWTNSPKDLSGKSLNFPASAASAPVYPEPDGIERGSEKAPITWLFEPESFAPMAKLVGERKYSILTDHLGTPYVMADAEGKEAWSADIDIYGARQKGTGHAQLCPFRFPGQYEDEETGLYYNRSRYYDPEAGAYVSQDPIGLAGGVKPYSYAKNPNANIDPWGLSACLPTDPKVADAIASGRPIVIVGRGMSRVNPVADAIRSAGGNVVTYSPKNFRTTAGNVNRLDVEANREWLRYWTKDKDALVVDIGGIPGNVGGPSPFYDVEKRSLYKNWSGIDVVKHDPGF